ncbi:hypothetical protein LJC15_04950 [Desulfovibrio sp. OttesenSCG-928-G11]|nr:hypothetical protein [Desulfovibrio sp. OttesenSCG-928-G11]
MRCSYLTVLGLLLASLFLSACAGRHCAQEPQIKARGQYDLTLGGRT